MGKSKALRVLLAICALLLLAYGVVWIGTSVEEPGSGTDQHGQPKGASAHGE